MILDYLVNNIAQVLMESMAASFVCPNWQVTIVWTLGIAYSGIFTLWSDLGLQNILSLQHNPKEEEHMFKT